MARKFTSAALALAFVAGASSAAYADMGLTPRTKAWINPGETWYVGLGVGVLVYDLPEFAHNDRTGSGDSVLDVSPNVLSAGPSGRIGYIFPSPPIGQNFRVEVSGAYITGDATDTEVKGGSGITVVAIDGSAAVTGSGAPFTTVATLKTEYDQYEIAARVLTDFPLAPDVTVTPSVAFFGGKAETTYFADEEITRIAGGFFEEFVNESTRTRRLGGELRGDLSFELAPNTTTLNLGVGVQVVNMRTKLKGNDCGDSGSGGGCDGALFLTTVTDTDTEWSYNAGLSAGVTQAVFPWMELTLAGIARFESDVPGIRNPTAANLAPASTKYDSAVHYGFYLVLTAQF